MGYSKQAYYVFGGTATPERADNADLMIEGIFGRKIGSVTASLLIERGYLIEPNISYINLKTKKQRVKNYAEDYKIHIIENEERNKHIIDIAKNMQSNGIPTLVLVQRINHGELLEKLIPNSIFIQGKSKDRQDAIEDMRTGRRNTLIATTLADEGLDIQRLSCLIMAGGGKSPIKCKQRVGRVLRTCHEENKKTALVYDFNDVGRWLPEHSATRKKILEQEPKFNVKNIDRVDFSKKKNIF
jgi:superfamily II DNA or RNA helicase